MIAGLSSQSSQSTEIDLTSQPASWPLSQYHTNWAQRTTQYKEIGRKYCKTTHSLFSVELTRNWLNGHNITQVTTQSVEIGRKYVLAFVALAHDNICKVLPQFPFLGLIC